MASTNIQTFPGKVGVSNTNPIHTLDIGSNVYIDDTADTKLRIVGNIHASGITVDGTITTIETENLSVKDPIILLASESTGTSDTGIIMKRAEGDSNVAIFYDEGVGLKIGHTLSTAEDIHLTVDTGTQLSTSIYGPVTVADSSTQALTVDGGAYVTTDFKVGASKFFVDVSESSVGIGTDAPTYTLDVHGTANVGTLTATSISSSSDLEVGTANLFVDTTTSNVGVGTAVPAYELDVVGNVHANYLIGDGSALSGIQSSNVSDFASNVTRIGTLETDLDSNVTRIATLETDLDSNVTRIGTLETDLDSNVTRIVALESGDLTIGGEKTFSSNLEVGTANLFVDTTTGNVGIGVTDPGAPLEIGTAGGLGTSYLHEYLGDGPSSATSYVLLLNPTTIEKRLIGTLYGVRGNTSIGNTFEAQLIIGTGNGGAVSGGLTFKYVGNESFSSKLVTLTYDSKSYIALALIPATSRGMTGGIYFEGKTSHRDDLQFITDLGTLSNITDYTPSDTDKITFSGNVGIGTTNPATALEINGDVGIGRVAGGYTFRELPGGDIRAGIHSTSGNELSLRIGTNTEAMRITGIGNVGIGATTMTEKLTINGNIDFTPVYGDQGDANKSGMIIFNKPIGESIDTSGNIDSIYYDDSTNAYHFTKDTTKYATGNAGLVFGSATVSGGATIGGSVGIGVTSPSYKLHVDGNFILDATVSSGGIVMSSESGNDTSIDDRTGYGGSSFAYCLRTTLYTSTASGRTYYFGLLDNDNSHFTLAMVGGGAPEPDPILMIDTASRLYVGEIWVAGIKQHSDDRIKYNEEHITGATGTLMKLKPQKYDKYLNLSAHDTDANAYTIESGFIAQDVYYDTPELRHLVSMARDATPSDTKPETPEDITQDPDYSDWGTKKATVDYTGFIPYIVRAIQENEETKGKVRARLPVSNVSDYSGLVVCSTDTPGEVALSTKHKDKRCFGVVSDVPGFVNTSGEGRVWVLGDIEAGDFITTSNVLPGYAMRQDSDFLMNYTLAKVTHVTDAPLKRVRQELSNVTYFMTTTYEEIDEKEWSTLPEDKRTTKEVMGYYEIDTDKEITIRDYNNLEEEKRQRYIQKPKTLYYFTKRQESKYSREGSVSVVHQELVNVLDEHGQLQWEDDPSGSAHKIRYLDADGNITDEANHVHKAAFVGCTYHCG